MSSVGITIKKLFQRQPTVVYFIYLGQEQLGKVGGGLLGYGMYVGYPGREALIPKTF